MTQNERIADLIELAGAHVALYTQLDQTLRQEQALLLAADMDHLPQAAAAKQDLARRIFEHAPRLAQAMARAAQELGLEPEPLPALAQLAARAPEPQCGGLRRLAQRLNQLKKDVAVNALDNQQYIQDSLDLISSSIRILTGSGRTGRNTYTPRGRAPHHDSVRPVRLSREV